MTTTYVRDVSESSFRSWPEPQFLHRRPLAAVLIPGAFLLFLVEAVMDAFRHSVWVRVGVIGCVVLYSVLYLFAIWQGLRLSRAVRVLLVVLLTLPPVAIALMMDASDLTYLTYSIVASLLLLPATAGIVYGSVAAAAELVATNIAHGTPDYRGGVVLIVMTVAMLSIRGFARQTDELALAREEIKALAVAEERARVARDLHDVLGHSLTTITVKAGLTRRILESSGDVERALVQVRDVERLSRLALTEIRATVSGYRKVSLPAEIAGAKAALLAAGIFADLPQAVDDVPGDLQEPFGYVLREGVTNVIRHSGASKCQIRLGQSWIEITDNGSNTSTVDGHDGNGLSGLRERLAKVGGKLTAMPSGQGGFVLRADVSAS